MSRIPRVLELPCEQITQQRKKYEELVGWLEGSAGRKAPLAIQQSISHSLYEIASNLEKLERQKREIENLLARRGTQKPTLSSRTWRGLS